MSKRARILLGGLLLTLVSAYFGVYIYSLTLPKKGSDNGWDGTWDGIREPRVTRVDPRGLATGLQVGDEIIAINGVKVKDDPGILDFSDTAPPGSRFTITVRRAGELRDVVIQTIPHGGSQFDPFYYVNLLFLMTGWIVFLLRPDDKQAWLLALMLGTLSCLLGDIPENLPSWINQIASEVAVLGLLFLPIFVHFFLIFPDPSPLLRRWPRLETSLYLPYILFILPVFAALQAPGGGGAWLFRFQWFRFSVFAINFLLVAYLAAGLVSLLFNYRAANPGSRRKLRVVMAGSAVGFFNIFLVAIGRPFGLQELMPVLWSWFTTAAYITLPLVPLSFVYAIIRHKVIPVSLIIRRSVRYLLVSRGSVALEAIAVGLTIALLFRTVFDYWQMTGRLAGVVATTVGFLVWGAAHRMHKRLLAPLIDRRFFRQSYDAQQIITELTRSLGSVTGLPQLLELVAKKIQSALQTENVTIFLRDQPSGDYKSAYSCDYSEAGGRAIVSSPAGRNGYLRQSAKLIEQHSDNGQPVEIEPADFLSERDGDGISTTERETLLGVKATLLMPLVSKDGMLGLISLGPRLGDLPFSREDKRLLMSVGGPATIAIENAQLLEQMLEEARRRQELEAENEQRAKELEEARQLQLSMLPKKLPQSPRLEVAAYMKPAAEVGGDYYDFHESDNGELTVVIGDATGHGLKAGTVVTAMKSLFRTFAGEDDLVRVLIQSSRVLKEMNLRSLFMGLTMIKLDGASFRIASAGMPPALIYRSEKGIVEEALIKAPPLGSISSYQYREQEFALERGDVVALMSDGFPERFNQDGEMFDYSRAKQSLVEAASMPPREIIEHFVRAGDQWANGRPQNDDITFVVLKVK
ncbi:MAG TPA: SpoIIE family protein phosphatase [Blastocatellia bacterium]|nr:SpoIIE family protein phosphatase [Blastocatellia bacterium]